MARYRGGRRGRKKDGKGAVFSAKTSLDLYGDEKSGLHRLVLAPIASTTTAVLYSVCLCCTRRRQSVISPTLLARPPRPLPTPGSPSFPLPRLAVNAPHPPSTNDTPTLDPPPHLTPSHSLLLPLLLLIALPATPSHLSQNGFYDVE